MTRTTGGRYISFPEEKWVRRIPLLIMAYTLAMLLLGEAIPNSSTLFQHLYIYIFGSGFIFLMILFILLWGKSRVRVLRINEKDASHEQK